MLMSHNELYDDTEHTNKNQLITSQKYKYYNDSPDQSNINMLMIHPTNQI